MAKKLWNQRNLQTVCFLHARKPAPPPLGAPGVFLHARKPAPPLGAPGVFLHARKPAPPLSGGTWRFLHAREPEGGGYRFSGVEKNTVPSNLHPPPGGDPRNQFQDQPQPPILRKINSIPHGF